MFGQNMSNEIFDYMWRKQWQECKKNYIIRIKKSWSLEHKLIALKDLTVNINELTLPI
jgi:predicted NACHT family NTPase